MIQMLAVYSLAMDHDTDHAALTASVLEGVGFALAEGAEAVHETGIKPTEVTLIGGGARSEYWRQLIADTIGIPSFTVKAAKLDQLLVQAAFGYVWSSNVSMEDAFPVPPQTQVHQPNPQRMIS